MDGKTALWFARARHGSSDYARMSRQRVVEDAMLAQLDPVNVLSRYKEIASAGKVLIHTDIPSGQLSTYLDLAIKAKKLGMTKLELVPPTIDVVNPNFTEIRNMIQEKLKPQATPTP